MTKALRGAWEWLFMLKKELSKDNTRENQERYRRAIRHTRDDIKRMEGQSDQLFQLMTNWKDPKWHVYFPEETGEYWTEYAIFPDNGITDEEMEEVVNDMWIHIYSPYDCTGKRFTRYIDWSRQPVGIVIIHHMSIDV